MTTIKKGAPMAQQEKEKPPSFAAMLAAVRPGTDIEAAFADIVTEIRDGRTDKRDGVETVVHEGVGDMPIFNGKPSAS